MDLPIRQVNRIYLDELLAKSRLSPRLRSPTPLHPDAYAGPQVLFNPIQPRSYMAPHRHAGEEVWIPVKGKIILCLLDDDGNFSERVPLSREDTVYFLVPEHTYHTAFAVERDSAFINVNQGPFDPKVAKKFPVWAPREDEDSEVVKAYFDKLEATFR